MKPADNFAKEFLCTLFAQGVPAEVAYAELVKEASQRALRGEPVDRLSAKPLFEAGRQFAVKLASAAASLGNAPKSLQPFVYPTPTALTRTGAKPQNPWWQPPSTPSAPVNFADVAAQHGLTAQGSPTPGTLAGIMHSTPRRMLRDGVTQGWQGLQGAGRSLLRDATDAAAYVGRNVRDFRNEIAK